MKKNNTHTGEWRPFPNHKVEEDRASYKQIQEAEERGRKKGMIQGLALAISYSYRGEDERGIWQSAGLTIDECIENDVDSFDMEMIMKHKQELEG